MNKKLSISILAVLLFFSYYSFGQGCPDVNSCAVFSPTLSPAIDWKNEFWAWEDMSGANVSQPESDEDWHYNLMEYKIGNELAGYIGIGFAGINGFEDFTIKDENDDVIDCYTRKIKPFAEISPCSEFETPTHRRHHHRQSIVFYDLDGNITHYILYNFGDLFAGVQDDNGDIYLAGTAVNPTRITDAVEIDINNEGHLNNIPLYYNPNSSTQDEFDISSNLDCSNYGKFQYKFNVLKIDVNGDLIWNNYYGIEDGVHNAFMARGQANTMVIDGSQLLVGGRAAKIDQGVATDRKFIVALDKSNGYVNWKGDIEPSQSGAIFDITKNQNDFIISGTDDVSNGGGYHTNAFISKHNNPNTSAFLNPLFKKVPTDIPNSILAAESFPAIDATLNQKSNSAIYVGNDIYWFILVNGDLAFSFANFKGRGAVVKMDNSGVFDEIDDIGLIRAYDTWMSGTPTDDGGFALVTTKQSPDYYGQGTMPTLAEPIDENNPSGSTIGDCLDDLPAESWCFQDGSQFFELMSTCSYIRKYDSNFDFEWDKIWDSTDNAPRECVPHNLKQQECVYRIIQSSDDGGLLIAGNTSSNFDDSYMVKLESDCSIAAFAGGATDGDLIAPYDDGIYEVTGNEVWNTPKKVLGQVHIMDGAKLTILNTTVEFAQNATMKPGIFVEQNGILVVDNSTLTNMDGCGDFWHGIEVWGNTYEHQYTFSGGQSHQGRAFLKNNSIVENARVGMVNWKDDDWNTRGGIISVDESTFLNCRVAIGFMSYQNFSPNNPTILRPDFSKILSSHFELNDNYIFDQNLYPPKQQITLWKTDRVKIEGCTFLNTSTVDHSETRSTAIYSHDANYLVREHCNDPIPMANGCQTTETRNTFTGWHKAIHAKETTSGRPILVRNSDFSKNMIGIEIEGVNHSEIYWNHFEMGGHELEYRNEDLIDHPNLVQLGVFSNATQSFSIEENTFEKDDQALYEGHGVLVYNSKSNDNRVYHNTFTDLKVGENGWQVNRNPSQSGKIPPGGIGLQFLCNTNSGNEVDLEMSRLYDNDLEEFMWAGMRREQGDYNPDQAAGNTFSSPDPDPNIYTHFTINSQYTDYTYVPNYSQAPTTSEMTPGHMLIYYAQTVGTCPTRYASGPSGNVKGKMITATDGLQGLEYNYDQLIDDGNTDLRLHEIALTWPSDAWNLRDQLIARSPYNSEEVLIAAVEKEIMPHAMLLEVLVANPEALRSGAVIKTVELELANPMPQYMIDLLYVAKDEKTLRTSMESAMANLHAEATLYQKQGVSASAFNLDETVATDSSLYYMAALHNLGSIYNLAYARADRGEFTTALSLLDSTRTHFKMTEGELDECNQLYELLSLIADVNGTGRTLGNMTAEQIADMQMIADNADAGLAAEKAQNALCFHYEICYDGDGKSASPNTIARVNRQVYDKAAIIDKINNTEVYPSPAHDYTTVHFQLLKAHENTTMRIYDGVGRIVETEILGMTYEGQILIDTRDYTNGVYLIEILQDGTRIETNKFMVAH